MSLNLNGLELRFELPELNDRSFLKLRRAADRLKAIAKNVGTNSNTFKAALEKLEYAVYVQKNPDLSQVIQRSVDVRAFTYLMATDEKFLQRITLTRSLFEHLTHIRSPMSRVALTQFIRSFFTFFDVRSGEETLMRWAAFLREQLEAYEHHSSHGQIAVYIKNKELIFSAYGPSQVVNQAKKEGIDLDVLLKRYSLIGFANARYIQLCRYQYYLQTLKSIPVGENHPILAEVVKQDVVNSPFAAKRLLGHEILEILIDRCPGNDISASWQSAILEIAGDPRVPVSSRRYQQWWSLLGEARIKRVRSWLSRFDLKLFLEVLEQSALESGNLDMKRMFPERKVFMQGLLNEGLVSDSRLFLSRTAEQYLKTAYRKEELPEYARVSTRDTSAIYLLIDQKVHMLEGSHSRKLKLMNRLPQSLELLKPEKTQFDNETFVNRPIARYTNEFGGESAEEGFEEFSHNGHLLWQHKAINFLERHGVNVDFRSLIPSSQVRQYKERFGSS